MIFAQSDAAVSAVEPDDHVKVYGATPPVGITPAEPLQEALQSMVSITEILVPIAVGSVITTVSNTEHKPASVTVTTYVPAQRAVS